MRTLCCVFLSSCLSLAAVDASAQTLRVAPAGGHPTKTTNVAGSGFATAEAVDIYFDTTDMLLTVTGSTGNISTVSLTVPAGAVPGQHWITAIGRRTGDAAQRLFIVNTDWPQRGFDARAQSYNPYENVINASNVNQLQLAWQAHTGGEIVAAPAVANGMVYIGSMDDKLYAFDAATGATKWTATTAGSIASSPAVVNGYVYVGSNDRNLHVYNARTGANVCSAGPIGWPVSSSPAVAGGVVYWGTQGGDFYASNAKTCATIWTVHLGSKIEASPAVANGRVFVSVDSGNLFALDATTGAQLWAIDNATPFSPAVANGEVYITPPSSLTMYKVGNAAFAEILLQNGVPAPASPAVAKTYAYVGTDQGYLDGINLASQTLTWAANAGLYQGSISASPAVANGVVYVGDKTGSLRAYDALRGTILWSAASDGAIDAAAAVADGMVFVGSEDDYLCAFALNGGYDPVYKRKIARPALAVLHPDRSLKPTFGAGMR